MTLTVTINYQDQATPDIDDRRCLQPRFGDRSHAGGRDARPTWSGTFQVTDDGQDGTGLSYEQGFVHLVVTAPSGVDFDSSTFAQVLWQLSDPAGTRLGQHHRQPGT